jgi:hypothetical protein
VTRDRIITADMGRKRREIIKHDLIGAIPSRRMGDLYPGIAGTWQDVGLAGNGPEL